MAYRPVDESDQPPLPFPEAFARQDDLAAQSQAAGLILLGNQQCDDRAGEEARLAASGHAGPLEAAPVDEVERLDVPLVRPTGYRFEEPATEQALAERCGLSRHDLPPADRPWRRPAEGVEGSDGALPADVFGRLADDLRHAPTPANLAVLFEASLRHPDPLVRVAAAIAYEPLSADPLRLVPILEDGLHHEDPLVREVAAAGLSRFSPGHPLLGLLSLPRGAGGPPGDEETSLLVHGTFARGSEWWQPGGSFHAHLKSRVPRFADLYSGGDRFDWSGRNRDDARSLGASRLLQWVEDRHEQGLKLIGHSHGGSLMMLASQQGLESELMVLLACPVFRHKYWPDFARVERVVSVRVRLDLVILVAGGGQRFRDPRIEENALPLWFNHSLPRTAETWERHRLAELFD